MDSAQSGVLIPLVFPFYPAFNSLDAPNINYIAAIYADPSLFASLVTPSYFENTRTANATLFNTLLSLMDVDAPVVDLDGGSFIRTSSVTISELSALRSWLSDPTAVQVPEPSPLVLLGLSLGLLLVGGTLRQRFESR